MTREEREEGGCVQVLKYDADSELYSNPNPKSQFLIVEKPRPRPRLLAFQDLRPGQSRQKAVTMAWLGLAYLGLAWPSSRPQAGPSTPLPSAPESTLASELLIFDQCSRWRPHILPPPSSSVAHPTGTISLCLNMRILISSISKVFIRSTYYCADFFPLIL